MPIDSIRIRETTAGSTYGKWYGGPIEVSSGSKKTRLLFSSGQNSNCTDKTVASVYVEKIEKGFCGKIKCFFLSMMNRKFVKCTHNKKTIFINVNSLSKRLGISPKEIRSNAKSENLFSFIEKSHKSFLSTQKKVDDQFKKIIQEKYQENGSNRIKRELYKATGIAAFTGFKRKEGIKEIGYSLKNGNILHLKKQKGSKWPLLTLFNKNVLGRGSFGSVRVVKELSEGRVSVAKIAHNFKAEKDTQNENDILGTLYKDRRPIGIQKKPYSLFDFKIENRNPSHSSAYIPPKYVGYIAPKYDSDLKRVIPYLKPKEKIECAKQLLNGLVELERQQICHGDIKEENCFFRRCKNGSIECVIADFGGSRSLKKGVSGTDSYTIGYRPSKYSSSLNSLRSEIRSEKEPRKRNIIVRTIRKLMLRSDVYAMGVVLSEILKNDRRFKPLIKKMKNPSWEKRITASKALQEFEKIPSETPRG